MIYCPQYYVNKQDSLYVPKSLHLIKPVLGMLYKRNVTIMINVMERVLKLNVWLYHKHVFMHQINVS